MGRPKIIPEANLRELLAQGATQAEIARRYKITRGAVSQRVKDLNTAEKVRIAIDPAIAVTTVWDTQAAAKENLQRVMGMLDNDCLSALDKLRVAREIRQHLDFSIRVIEPLYRVSEFQAFVDEVINQMEEMDPAVRATFLAKLHARRELHRVNAGIPPK